MKLWRQAGLVGNLDFMVASPIFCDLAICHDRHLGNVPYPQCHRNGIQSNIRISAMDPKPHGQNEKRQRNHKRNLKFGVN